ncbi:MAG: VanW family protein [Turicibacter sp.]|nr:VanW family protein [Turicibacter sp.]
MSLKKKVVIGGAIAVVAMGLVFGGIKAFEYYEANQLVVAYEDKTFPNIKVNEKDVSELSKGKLTTVLKKEVEGFETRTIEIKIGDQQFTKTLADFNLVLNHDINKLADEIFTLGKDLDILEQAKRIEQAPAVEYTIDYSYDEELLDEWIQTITDEVYVEKEEPTFQMVSYGQFEVNEGQVGYSIDSKILKTQIQKALNDISDEPISISVEVDVDKQSLDPELLKSVNTKISTYSSTFPVGIPRAKNVELATSKVDKALLMPGDEFSFTDKVSPVISSSGYVNATVFLNSKPVDGIGGGICQVSSTLYNTLLLAGIMPTERRNHSLEVGYVPIGLDATMAEDLIDFKFVNTLDYPIYINAYTKNGTLTIEFWSNENALNGMTYKPSVKHVSGKKYQTYLLGYDANGSLVYNEYIDTSTYK